MSVPPSRARRRRQPPSRSRRVALAAVIALLGGTACRDTSAPDSLVPPDGIYVVTTIDGAALPQVVPTWRDPSTFAYDSALVVAETLYLSHTAQVRRTGGYRYRSAGTWSASVVSYTFRYGTRRDTGTGTFLPYMFSVPGSRSTALAEDSLARAGATVTLESGAHAGVPNGRTRRYALRRID